jgi:hypothetical protein
MNISGIWLLKALRTARQRSKVPKTNSICKRFYRIMQEELHAIVFRKKIYNNLRNFKLMWMFYQNTITMKDLIPVNIGPIKF